MKATKEIEKETNKCKILRSHKIQICVLHSSHQQKNKNNNDFGKYHRITQLMKPSLHSFISQITKKASQLLICARAEVLCFSTEALRQLM